jgi:hypothetical protein
MKSSSALINRSFRRHLSPVLRESGFDRVDARNAWKWENNCIWVFNIHAVGSYFSSVTGWPPSSVCAWLGIFFEFISSRVTLKKDPIGRDLPPEYLCHIRAHLETAIDQDELTRGFSNPAERRRKDIWWLDPGGANSEEVTRDIVTIFKQVALPWYQKYSDLNNVLTAIEDQRNCLNKFAFGTLIAQKLGQVELEAKYRSLAEKEAERIGFTRNKETPHTAIVVQPAGAA